MCGWYYNTTNFWVNEPGALRAPLRPRWRLVLDKHLLYRSTTYGGVQCLFHSVTSKDENKI